MTILKVSLFGILFLVSPDLLALRDKSNAALDQAAEKLAARHPELPSFSKTVAFAKKEVWDSVLIHTMKSMPQTKDLEILDFLHYYRAEAFHKKLIYKYANEEFKRVRPEFEFYPMVNFNLGCVNYSLSKFDKALSLFRSIDTTDRKTFRMLRFDKLLHNMGTCYLFLKNYSTAETCFLREVQLLKELKDNVSLIGAYNSLAVLYYEQYLDAKAIVYYTKAYELSKKYGTFELKQMMADNMAVVEENRKNYKEALKYRKEYEGWMYSLNDQNKIYEVAQVEKKLAVAQKQQRVELLETENKLKQARVNTYLFVALLLAVILVLGIYFYRQSVLRSRVILRQKQELDLLNATKDQLFSIVSHDLRSSVHALGVSNHKLKDQVSKQEYTGLESQLEESSIIATNTYNMLDNLLNWALLQTEGGYFKPEEHRLSMLIDQVAYNFKGVLIQKDIAFENRVSKSVKVFVDAESLKIVLRNFMDNSIKFSDPGSRITVNLVEDAGETVTFRWEDTGKGMSEETRLKLLSDSTQLTKKDHEKEIGSGLGMNLCQAMLAKNEGKLDIWSRQNEGTHLIVTLKKA